MPRQADYNRADAIFLVRETRNLLGHHVQRVDVETRWPQDGERPRECARGIAHRDTNAAFAHIQPHESHSVTLY